jgi:HK97 family phage portal protein
LKFPFFKKSIRASEVEPLWHTQSPQPTATWTNWTTERAINHGYKINGTVYACIHAIATAAASIPWEAYKKTGYKKWEVVEDHPIALLLEQPNPFMSRKEFIERITIHLFLGGNAVMTKVKGGGQVTELWTLPPDAIKIQPSRKGFIERYVYERDGITMSFDPKDVMHGKFVDPSNQYWGMSPLQAGARVVDTDTEATTWNKISMENRAVTNGVFSFEHPLTTAQWEQAREMIKEQHSGIYNAHAPWILGAGAKWEQMSLTPQEMDFIESRKLSREEICSIFGVPPVMIGIFENATLANIETARKIFWQDTIIPFLDLLKGVFNLQLMPDFDPALYVDYDLTGVEALQENWNDKINNAKALWGMGVPFNQINQRLELGFDDIETGETSYLPTSVISASGMALSEEASAANIEQTRAGVAANNGQGGQQEGGGTGGRGRGSSQEDSAKSVKALNLPTLEAKYDYVDRIEEKRTRWLNFMMDYAANMFEAEGERVAKAVARTDGTADAVDKAIDDAIDHKGWQAYFEQNNLEMVSQFASLTFSDLKASVGPDEVKGRFGLTARVRDYIAKWSGEKVTQVTEFTKSVIGGIVMNVMQEEGGMDAVAKRIKEVYTDMSGYRAYRIGRTEVGGASTYGSMEGAKATGLKLQKQWLTSRDRRVRDSHTHMQDEAVDMDAKFSNGLDYPCEYGAGRPSETINCRCTVGYITD